MCDSCFSKPFLILVFCPSQKWQTWALVAHSCEEEGRGEFISCAPGALKVINRKVGRANGTGAKVLGEPSTFLWGAGGWAPCTAPPWQPRTCACCGSGHRPASMGPLWAIPVSLVWTTDLLLLVLRGQYSLICCHIPCVKNPISLMIKMLNGNYNRSARSFIYKNVCVFGSGREIHLYPFNTQHT